MVKTPPFHVFHPPSRSLAPRISHQSLPVSTSSVASAKEEPSHPVAKRLFPKLIPPLFTHICVISIAIAVIITIAIMTLVIYVVDDIAQVWNLALIDQFLRVRH